MVYDVFSVRAHGIGDSHDTFSCPCKSLLKGSNDNIAKEKKRKKLSKSRSKSKKGEQMKKVERKGRII
jgi:hypothetical protein